MKFLSIILIFLSIESSAQKTMNRSDKSIKKDCVVHLPIDSVWKLWTTHEGLKTFFGSDDCIELRPGGKFEIYFLLNNPKGMQGSEGCKIIECKTNQLLSFTWNAPPVFKEIRESDYKTSVSVYFKKVDDHTTHLELVHDGWPEQETWKPVFEYFTQAWGVVLANLTKK
jgi:uncharacterized protein YndB with AHSA1/START domain